MTTAGVHTDELAQRTGVDAKTVQRWLTGRTPYMRHRIQIAKVLATDQRTLWPEADLPVTAGEDRLEIIAAFAYGDDLHAPDWRAMLTNATGQIDLLDDTLTDILSTPGVTDLLTAKATAGCHVRVLISSPDSFFAQATDLEQDAGDLSPAESPTQRQIAVARGHLEPLLQWPGILIREYVAGRFNSILRVDDEMLLTLHLFATPGSRAPLLHLRRQSNDGLFDRFASHYQAIWQHATTPFQPDPELHSRQSTDPT